MRRRLNPWLLVVLAGASVAPSAAHGQNALGDGRTLDRNLRRDSGGFNDPAKNWRAEADFRNAIVTGNVAGGASFRGNVGYTAPNDFRGQAGTNDLFQFQRDAVSSALALNNVRGLNGLKVTFDQTIYGQTAGIGGEMIVNRPAIAAGARSIADPASATTTHDLADRFGMLKGSLRSVAEYYSQLATQPSVIGFPSKTESGELPPLLTASNLQGIKALKQTNSAFGVDEKLAGQFSLSPTVKQQQEAEKAQEAERKARTPFDNFVESARVKTETLFQPLDDGRLEPGRVEGDRPNATPRPVDPDAKVVTPAVPETEKGEKPKSDTPPLLPPGVAPKEPEPEPKTVFDRIMDDARKQFGRAPETPEEKKHRELFNPEPKEKSRSLLDPQPEREETGKDKKDKDGKGAKEASTEEDSMARIIRLLKTDRVNVDTLKTDSGNSAYDRHMREGEASLASGAYFDAEERFTAAIAVRPGDAMAAAGRVHSQIGAGLYVSAALNLRNLYRAYPEMLFAQFDAKLLPSGERLEKVRAQLRERMKPEELMARDAGLLLAYLGVQTGNKADVADALKRLDEIDEAFKEVSVDPVDATLRRAWVQ
ncbi:MAG TPA: hypothetical protein VG797_07250 [Phycisphaerales bacterium]|nr:hypothetical protein [Phycisphaerales bacterium]